MVALDGPRILVVDDDGSMRRLVRTAFELEGLQVVDAESLERARRLLDASFAGVVLDRELPDGDGLELLPDIYRRSPRACVAVHSTRDDGREPPSIPRVDKGDTDGLLDALGLGDQPEVVEEQPLAVIDLVRAEADLLVDDWQELCRWDPMLPPDCVPPLGRLVVDAVTEAIQRPQPLGWGVDPALARVVELFAVTVDDPDLAVGELICLRETLRRHVAGRVPPLEAVETEARVDMVIDRAILVAARVAAARLRSQALADALTGLGNRRAFDRALEAEAARADRHGRHFAVVLVDVDHLKAVNDQHGHAAGDAVLRRMASVLAGLVRGHDAAFRIGGDEFALVLPETDRAGAQALVERLRKLGAPGFTAGAAVYESNHGPPSEVVERADRELIDGKSARTA